MLTITKLFEFEAAHFLPDYKGLCKNLHGHTFHLEVTIRSHSETLDQGMILDFSLLKKIVEEEIIFKYDHSFINDLVENPTSEVLVKLIAVALRERFEYTDLVLHKVVLWETSKS